jgi:hypothetical protein
MPQICFALNLARCGLVWTEATFPTEECNTFSDVQEGGGG